MTLTNMPGQVRYFIERGPDDAAIERAAASLERGEAEAGHPDRELPFALSPADDPEEVFTGSLSVSEIRKAANGQHAILGMLREDRSAPLRLDYSSTRSADSAYGTAVA